jgi:hypothetical protein
MHLPTFPLEEVEAFSKFDRQLHRHFDLFSRRRKRRTMAPWGRASALLVACATLAAGVSGLATRTPSSRTPLLSRACRAAGRAPSRMMEPMALDLDFLNGLAAEGEEAIGFAVGDRVRVIASGLAFMHVPGHKPLDPRGAEGEVVRVITDISANLPVVVAFEKPRKYRAHFEVHELERL